MLTQDYLKKTIDEKGAGLLVLVDPDRLDEHQLPRFAQLCEDAEVDAFLVGSSILVQQDFDDFVCSFKSATSLPVIGFPGSINQISASLDAILFLSIISGRNPEYLFGQHVHAAPIIQRAELEALSTGYMLIESGRLTTAQYISGSLPLPRNKPEVAAATGLAAQMMGMKYLFADGGSGADESVPEEMIFAISESCSIPLIVGGGISSPIQASRKVQAGASLVVIGNAIEDRVDGGYIKELASAVHVAVPRPMGSD
ncbi:MAG: geranylgeranylglyceryl/heptaprenylglyceryl phosphate synthase [Rhodothermales bacterium]|nr:geranylgeranylglyceryl/heptaprenylglyceryl phosphate synthase [Rhodothermales bacterium]